MNDLRHGSMSEEPSQIALGQRRPRSLVRGANPIPSSWREPGPWLVAPTASGGNLAPSMPRLLDRVRRILGSAFYLPSQVVI